MRKKSFLILFAITNMLTIEAQEKDNSEANNPFFQPYNTPYKVPPFDLIKNEHFKPAITEGIKLHQAQIDAIANNTGEATFENTILAMENAGEFLSNVNIVFSNLNGANTNEDTSKHCKRSCAYSSGSQ